MWPFMERAGGRFLLFLPPEGSGTLCVRMWTHAGRGCVRPARVVEDGHIGHITWDCGDISRAVASVWRRLGAGRRCGGRGSPFGPLACASARSRRARGGGLGGPTVGGRRCLRPAVAGWDGSSKRAVAAQGTGMRGMVGSRSPWRSASRWNPPPAHDGAVTGLG